MNKRKRNSRHYTTHPGRPSAVNFEPVLCDKARMRTCFRKIGRRQLGAVRAARRRPDFGLFAVRANPSTISHPLYFRTLFSFGIPGSFFFPFPGRGDEHLALLSLLSSS